MLKQIISTLFLLLSFCSFGQDASNQGPVLSIASINDTRLPLDFDGSTVTFTAPEASGFVSNNILYTPEVLYENGKTHIVWQNPGTEAGRRYILTYDERYGVSRPIGFSGGAGTFDPHHRPTIFKSADRLFSLYETAHNSDPIRIEKTRADNDAMIFESTASVIGPSPAPTYPNTSYKNGNFLVMAQTGDTDVSIYKNTSGVLDGTWVNGGEISLKNTGEDEQYIGNVQNETLETDESIFVISGRNDALPGYWFRKYLFRASVTVGGQTFYNWDRTFSKTSTVTAAELLTNFIYYNTGADTNQGYVPIASVDLQRNFYDVTGDGSGGYDFIFIPAGSFTTTIKAITLPGSPTIVDNGSQGGACHMILPINTDEIYTFWRVEVAGVNKVYLYKSVDLGDNWTFQEDVFPDVSTGITEFAIPNNALSISNNRNFIVVGTGAEVSGYSPKHIRRAVFGTIQPETGNFYDATPYTTAEYDALMLRSYYVEAGKVTNTGTALTTLIDQSPSAQDATQTGGVTIDDATTPTFATTDGVNDRIIIPVTGLTTLTEGTIIFVAQVANGVGSTVIGPSNNGATTRFMSYTKSSDNKTQHSVGGGVSTKGKTSTSGGYQIFAFTHQNGRCNVLHWLDGELQKRDPVTRNLNEGNFFDTITGGLTHLSIGAIIRSSSSLFYALNIKHAAVTGTPLNEEQMAKAMTYLANKYSITLVDFHE